MGLPSDPATWTEHVEEVLALAGLKRGGARQRIIDLLAREQCAISAVEIEEMLRARDKPTARASIYRVLDLLVDHGLVERVTVGPGLSRFERTHPDGEHHHHLVCEHCGVLMAFDDPELERAIDSLPDRLGIHVERHEVVLRGACPDCED
jgi:Fur family transcriptional regulator, ferric uptake regulator